MNAVTAEANPPPTSQESDSIWLPTRCTATAFSPYPSDTMPVTTIASAVNAPLSSATGRLQRMIWRTLCPFTLPSTLKRSKGRCGWRFTNQMSSAHTTPCAITVAMAAPATPQPQVRIISGSSAMLSRRPTAFAQKLSRDRPAAVNAPETDAVT